MQNIPNAPTQNISGLYILLPFKFEYGSLVIKIDQTMFDMIQLPLNNAIQGTNRFDIIYIIHIWNVQEAKQKNIRINFKINNTHYWNARTRTIEDVPAHRRTNPIAMSFIFQIQFIKFSKMGSIDITPLIIPSDTTTLSLAEELSYFKIYFESINQWNNYCTFYLNEDLINYIKNHVKNNEKLEMEVFLFIFRESNQNLLYYINQFEKDIHSVELSSNKILMNYLRESNAMIKVFQTILNFDDQMYNSSIRNPTKTRNIKNSFREFFLLYLMKFSKHNLEFYIRTYNESYNGVKRLMEILLDDKHFKIFSEIGITVLNFKKILKYCHSEMEIHKLFKFSTKYRLTNIREIFQHENNVGFLQNMERYFTKKLYVTFSDNSDKNNLATYLNDLSYLKNLNFTKIFFTTKTLTNMITKMPLVNLLKFVSENANNLNLLGLSFQIGTNFVSIKNQQQEIDNILSYVNSIYEKKHNSLLQKITLDYNFTKEVVKEGFIKNVNKWDNSIQQFKNVYKYLAAELSNELSAIFHDIVLSVINDGSQRNVNLLNLLKQDKEKCSSSYIQKIMKLISFADINDPFPEKFKSFMRTYSSSMITFISDFLKNLKTLNEVINFYVVVKNEVNDKVRSSLFVQGIKIFNDMIGTSQSESINLIEKFVEELFSLRFTHNDTTRNNLKELFQKIQQKLEQNSSKVLFKIYTKIRNSNFKQDIETFLLQGIHDLSAEENSSLFIQFQNDNQMIKIFFRKLYEKNWKIKEDHFYQETKEFIFFTKLIEMGAFKKNEFVFFEYFKDTTKNLKTLQKQLRECDFLLDKLSALERMESSKKLKKYLQCIFYEEQSEQAITRIYTDLLNKINEFKDYKEALVNLNAFENYFYKDQKREQEGNINRWKTMFEKKKIKEVLNSHRHELNQIQSQNIEARKYIKLFESKFYAIIYSQIQCDDEHLRRTQSLDQFNQLKNLLNINTYKNINHRILNDIVYFCDEEVIKSEFAFLEKYFPFVQKNNVEEVKRKIISGANKNNILNFIESTLLLCKEYQVQKTDFLNKYETKRNILSNSNVDIQEIQEIEHYLSQGIIKINEKNADYNKILKAIHNKENFFAFVRDKTIDSVTYLNEFIGDIDDPFLSPGDIPKLKEVVSFCQELKNHKFETDTSFLSNFKSLAAQRKIANTFELVVKKFLSFKDLYDKTTNKEEFAKEKIKQILANSTITIKSNENKNNFGDITCNLKYSDGRTMSESDLFELKDKAQLKNKTDQHKDDAQRTQIFSDIIQNIDYLVSTIRKLITIGESVAFHLQIKISNNKVTEILNLKTNNIEGNNELENVIQQLKLKFSTIKTAQREGYKNENNVLLTFIYGKIFFQLNNYFQGKGGIELLEPLFKYITKNKYKREFNIQKPNDTDNVNQFLKNCVSFLQSLLQQNNLNYEDIFESNKIHTNSTTIKGLYTSQIKQETYEEDIIKIYMRYTKSLPIPQTLLLCNKNTTSEEIIAFIYRALYYNGNVLFGIAQIEFLNLSVKEEIISILEDELLGDKKRAIKSTLVLFYKNNDLDIITTMDQKNLKRVFDKLTEENEDLSGLFKEISIICSDASGVGKSYTIENEAKRENKKYKYFPIGGDFDRESIIKRFQEINFISGKILIHIDIQDTQNKDNIDLLKDFLFSLLVLKSYFYNNHIFYFDSSDSSDPSVIIKIEIPYGFNDYCELCPILKLFKKKTIYKTSQDSYDIPSDLESKEQIVGGILNLLKTNQINQTSERTESLTPQKCNALINEYFKIQQPTFYQKKIFISILADQFKFFTENIYLGYNVLHGNGLAKNNPNLYLIRGIIIESLIKLTEHFTKGAYGELLEEQNQTVSNLTVSTRDFQKMKENAIRLLSTRRKPVSFKDIKPSLLLFNNDKQSITVVSTIKPKTVQTQQDKEEYNNFKELINSQNFRSPKELDDYEEFKQDQFITQLIKVFDIRSSTFKGKPLLKDKYSALNKLTSPNKQEKILEFFREHLIDSFVFTADNFAKLIMILIRLRANVPVILMGETGCGKTFLIRTMSQLSGTEMKILNVHAGTTEKDIINFLQEHRLFKDQDLSIDNQIWVFLDEINTCNSLGLISEIMLKQSANGRKINNKVVFIGACNPYRFTRKQQTNDCGISTRDNGNQQLRLVYTVHPIPHSLLNYVMDFGTLDEIDEGKYIDSMILVPIEKQCKKLNINTTVISKHKDFASRAIKYCQKFIRIHNEESAVSIREVRRFVIFYEWFVKYLLMKIKDPLYERKQNCTYNNLCNDNKSGNNTKISFYAIILAIYVCYYLRLPESEERDEMNSKLCDIFQIKDKFTKFPEEESLDIASRVVVRKGIAYNAAFLNNLYGLFVCVNTRVPVIICGKPGCSKSLSMQILIDSMKGEDSENYLFKNLPRVYLTSFQGAKTTTSQGVLNAFNKARKLVSNEQQDKLISLLFFDEMGLAEISENNPLKVIHSELEYDDHKNKIAFVGISNWTLDASKMNRCVFLAILEPDEHNLKKTAKSIADSYKEGLDSKKENLTLLEELADVYREYKDFLKQEHKKFYDYHGLRDFYNLIKCACFQVLSQTAPKIDQIQRICIERNLAGLDFSIEQCNKILLKIKQTEESISKNYNVLERIKQNLEDYTSRYLLILSESTNIQFLIESLIKEKGRNYVFYNGSQFKEDKHSQTYNIKMLTQMNKAAEEGKILCLSNLEYIYPSYYDVFNQNYMIREKKKYAKVALGTNTNIQTYIHDEFRVIVFLNNSFLSNTNRQENKLLDKSENYIPETPFLNRFEKHILSYDDLLQIQHRGEQGNKENLKIVVDNFSKQFEQFQNIKKNKDKIIINPKEVEILVESESLNTSMVSFSSIKAPGFLINCSIEEIKGISHQLILGNSNLELQNLPVMIWEKLARVFPQDFLAFLQLPEIGSQNHAIKNVIYKGYKNLGTKNASLKKYLKTTNNKKSIIYTFTSILAKLNNLNCESKFNDKTFNIQSNTIKQITINSVNNEIELEKMLTDFYMDNKQNLCILKFTPFDCKHLNSIKNLIDNLEKRLNFLQNIPKKILLIIYFKKFLTKVEYKKEEIEQYILIQGNLISQIASDYEQITIDNLLSEDEDINIADVITKNNKELFLLSNTSKQLAKQVFDLDEIIQKELPNSLNKIKYILKGEFPDTVSSIEDYKKKLLKKLKENKNLLEYIKDTITEAVSQMDSFVWSVFLKEKDTFTNYYTSYLEVLKNYLKRNCIELLIKVLFIFEKEGVFYPVIFHDSNDINKEFLENIKKTINLNTITVHYEDYSNEITLIPGMKIIQSTGKFKLIRYSLESNKKKFITLQNQYRKTNEQSENYEEIENEIKNNFEEELKKQFTNYEDIENEIYHDYIRFYLSVNNLEETSFFVKFFDLLIQTKFKDNQNFIDKIFWLEINEEDIIIICKMYQEFLENSDLPFFDNIKGKIGDLNDENTNTLNTGLFETSEVFFQELLKQESLSDSIDKLKRAVQTMRYLKSSLKFNSNYLHECETIIEVYDFFPENLRKEKTKKYIDICKKMNKDNLEGILEEKLQFLKEEGETRPHYERLIINILKSEIQKNNNTIIDLVIKKLLETTTLVLKSKSILYLILITTDEFIEPQIPNFNDDNDNYNEISDCFNNANHLEAKKVFEILNDDENQNINDLETKRMIIEDHFLFIFENISKDFFEKLIIKARESTTDESEKKKKEVSILHEEDENTQGIIYKYLDKALTIIVNNSENERIKTEAEISCLYAIAYLKTYLNYLVEYSINKIENLGNITTIVTRLTGEFGGDAIKTLKKSMCYYIMKLFDKHYGVYYLLKNISWDTNQLDEIQRTVEIKEEDIPFENELDFPYFNDTNNYNNTWRIMNSNFNGNNFQMNEIQNLFQNSFSECVKFLFNNLFAFSLNKFKKLNVTNENYNKFISDKFSFFKKFMNDNYNQATFKDFRECLLLFMECEANQRSQFFQDIKHLSQKEYVKLLHCFELVTIIASKGSDKIHSLYLSLGQNIKSNSSQTENIHTVIYLSLDLFGRYLSCFSSKEKEGLEPVKQSLLKLFVYFQELETKVDVPIEIFFHCFSKKFQENIDITNSYNYTLNNINNFAEQYTKDREELFNITPYQTKSIIREVYDPKYYTNNAEMPGDFEKLPYLRYFFLTNLITKEKHKARIIDLQREQKFPMFNYLYNREQIKNIEMLSALEKLNPFGKMILTEYNNKILEAESRNKIIDTFITRDNELEQIRRDEFEKFKNTFNTIKKLFESNEVQFSDDLDKNSSVACCLPMKENKYKGYQYYLILERLKNVQNTIMHTMKEFLNNSPLAVDYKYLVKQITKTISIQDVDKSDIIQITFEQNEFKFTSIEDMFRVYAERDCFNNQGIYNYRRYGNVIVDDIHLHEELTILLLQGKYSFDKEIQCLKFKSEKGENIIQERLNKEQKEKNRRIEYEKSVCC